MRENNAVSSGFIALLCTWVYLDTEGWLPPFLLAAGLHELGHLLVMRLHGCRPEGIRLGLSGAVISARFPTLRAELCSTIAGPLVNLLLALVFYRRWQPFFTANLLLLLYNLLPVYPLDGGRICRLLLVRRFGLERGELWARRLAVCCLVLLAALCAAAGALLQAGLLPWLAAAFFLARLAIPVLR